MKTSFSSSWLSESYLAFSSGCFMIFSLSNNKLVVCIDPTWDSLCSLNLRIGVFHHFWEFSAITFQVFPLPLCFSYRLMEFWLFLLQGSSYSILNLQIFFLWALISDLFSKLTDLLIIVSYLLCHRLDSFESGSWNWVLGIDCLLEIKERTDQG